MPLSHSLLVRMNNRKGVQRISIWLFSKQVDNSFFNLRLMKGLLMHDKLLFYDFGKLFPEWSNQMIL